MPRRDGTGPIGMGPMTGRGMGSCNTRDTRNFWRRNNNAQYSQDDKTFLQNRKEMLESELKNINNALNDR